MKRKLVVFTLIFLFAVNCCVLGFGPVHDTARSNYVVIGAFAIQKNAFKFVEDVKKLNFTAITEINPRRNLYYVYVLHTANKTQAMSEANKIRKSTPLFDTWVFSGLLGNHVRDAGADLNPLTEKAITKVEIMDVPVDKSQNENTTKSLDPVISSDSSAKSTQASETPAEPVKTERAPVADAAEGSRNFVFRIFTAADQAEMTGDIDVIDVDRSRKVATFSGNQNVVVHELNKSGKLSLECEVFGYRKVTKNLDFNNPSQTEGFVQEGNQNIIPFELVRLKKGDIAIMYSVYFYKDAAVMRPESRTEVSSLLDMMKGNPKYKIRLHGHTNGSAAGKIISMGDGKKFFSLNDTKEGFGSAKKLSEARASVIRSFLVDGGIDIGRMEIKAWGGKHPLYDRNGNQAQSNVRVEIEILNDK